MLSTSLHLKRLATLPREILMSEAEWSSENRLKICQCLVQPGMLSHRGQAGLEAKFVGLGLGLVVPGLGLSLGLMQQWPRSHEAWPRGLMDNHQNSASSVHEDTLVM